jgi:hypothetical protein
MLCLGVAVERIGMAKLATGTEVPGTGIARSELSDVGRNHAKTESDRRSATNITVETLSVSSSTRITDQRRKL